MKIYTYNCIIDYPYEPDPYFRVSVEGWTWKCKAHAECGRELSDYGNWKAISEHIDKHAYDQKFTEAKSE